MNKKSMLGLLSLCALTLGAEVSIAAPQAKAYQVTGPVLEVTDTAITVKKGEDNWQIARDAGTKISGELKVGAKVTVHYRMVATDVEVKADKAEKPNKPAAPVEAAKPKKNEKK
jgi:RNase P/RNase MRP subunit p29